MSPPIGSAVDRPAPVEVRLLPGGGLDIAHDPVDVIQVGSSEVPRALDQFYSDSLVGRALLELIERRKADKIGVFDPDAINAPGNSDHYSEAIDVLLDARASTIDALASAIESSSHYLLCQAVGEITTVLSRVERAQKEDAS
jgi:hypothetical protein